MVEIVRQNCNGEKVRPVHIKAFQGRVNTGALPRNACLAPGMINEYQRVQGARRKGINEQSGCGKGRNIGGKRDWKTLKGRCYSRQSQALFPVSDS